MALKQLRELNNYTHKQVADGIGVTVEQIIKYETGLAKPRGSGVGSLAKFFNVEVSTMIDILDNTPAAKNTQSS